MEDDKIINPWHVVIVIIILILLCFGLGWFGGAIFTAINYKGEIY